MDKRWSIEKEKEISEKWRKKDIFQVDTRSKKIYSIDTPPPYVNAPVHIGQAITYCYMDFFARYKRMKGFDVVFPLGLDRNGLPIEMAAEKKFNVNPLTISREKFIKYCEKILEEMSSESMDTFSRLGISFSSYKFGEKIGQAYKTDSEEYRTLTQSTFYDMYERGLIYEDKKVVNYCPGCQTTLADAEIDYMEKQKKLYTIKFLEKESKEEFLIATTRPELLGACAAVLYNPEDKRYKKFKGKTLITPFYNKEVPLIEHNSAKIEFGTGLVMMCSFGDLTDIQFFREQELEPIILIGEDGKLNEKSGPLEGLKPDEARKIIVEELKKQGLYEKEEIIENRVPVCERSKDQVEFIEMQEYYLKQIPFKKEILELQKRIKFHNESSRNILTSWIEGINQDWPLSRRRYYATPIPLWKCPKCDEVILGERGKYCVPWKEKKICKKCKTEAIPETRVFDTWFDSSISELYVLGYERENEFFRKSFPCSLRPQGKEIIRTWLYYTVLRAYLLKNKPAFENVWVNYHILDAKRNKMSKSKGNVIDPHEIIKNEGAEALRFWSAIEGDLTKSDFATSREKISAEIKTLNKLWNIAKFVSQFKEVKSKPKKITSTDKLLIDYMEYLTLFCEENYEEYNFHLPALKLRHFLWEVFASHYIELIKNRAYNQEKKFSSEEQKSALYTLKYLLEKMLILLYPLIPMITSELYSNLFKKDILKEKFPKTKNKISDVTEKINSLIAFNSEIWKKKKELGISLRNEITDIKIPEELKNFKKDLIATHKII